MAKSIYELALHYSGHAGCYRAAAKSLVQDQSEFNIKYWSKQMDKWAEEQAAFETDLVTTEVVESSTYYDPEEVPELA